MTVALGDVVRVEMRSTPSAADILNVYHLALTGPSSLADADALDDLIEAFEALALLVKAVVATAIAFDKIRAINVTQDEDLGVASFVTTTGGEETGNLAPEQIATGLTLYTGRLASFGRKFLPPPGINGVTTSGRPTSTHLTNAALVGAFLLEEFVATNGDWRFGIVSTLDGAFLPIQEAGVSTTFVTQRRRRGGVGS